MAERANFQPSARGCTTKKERIKKRIYKNREIAIADISDYIEAFYNTTRRHSHLGGVSPEEFESAAMGRRAVH